MALKHREELVGKRFLSVSCTSKLKVTKITEWEWRAGIVRAASHKDPKHPDLTVLVEFDDLDWKRREWIKVYDEDIFLVFLVEHTLVWAPREDNPIRGGAKNLYWPAVNFKPLVDKVGLKDQTRKPIEYLVDRKLKFTEYVNLKAYQEHDREKQSASRDYPEVRKAIKQWTEYQDGQKILLTTPSVLVGYRVEVYRVEGTTQWYTAVIVSYNDNTRELTLTDDTVLEEHNEDPCLVQMKLIGDGVVESILKGENIGITPRRRACTQQRVAQVQYSTRTRNQQQSPTAVPIRITSAIPAIHRKSRYRQGSEENLLDSTVDKDSGLSPESPDDCKRRSLVENCSVIRLLPLPSNNKKRTTQKVVKRKDDISDDDIDEPLSSLLNSRKVADSSTDSPRDEDSSDQEDNLKNYKKNHRKQPRPKRVNSLQEEDSAEEDAKLHGGSSRAVSPTNAGDVASQDNGAMSQVERPLLEDPAKVDSKAVGGPKSPAADPKTDLTKRVGRNGSPIDVRKVESAKSSSPLVFCDPGLVNSKRQFDTLHQPPGLMHPAGLTHTATAAYPRVPNIGQHARPPMHMGHYGLSSPLMSSQHMSPAPGSPMEQSSIHPQAYRQLLSQHPLLPAQYGSHVGLGMLWQQKFPAMTTPSNHWMMDIQYMERERALAARLDRERREEQERMERDRLEREKAEKEMERERQEKERREREKAERERLERERQERERLEREERERVQREAVQQHFEESLARLANEKVKWKGGWNHLLKPLPTTNMGRCSPVVTVHSHSIHSSDIEKEKREKIVMETKERHNNIDRGRQDQERWMALVQQRNEQAADLSHSQNFALVEQRQGNVHSKMEGYTVSRSSPHPSIVTSSIASKSGVTSSPIIATSTAATAQSKPEASFSLYGYQPFQHTYITQAQLKAREENKATVNANNQMVPVGRQPSQQSTHSREKEASIPFERSATPGNSRTSTPGSQPSTNKQQLKAMRSIGSEHTSPVYQPAVGGSGAFRPYEYTPQSPAPAHQNTSSPGLGTRIGTPHFHRASPQQEQPQNLVKGEPTEGSVAQHLPYQRYESSRSAASSSPSMQGAGYASPYGAIKNNIPATSSPHSYNLIQQGVVPNPLYTPASSGGHTTVPPCVTTVTQISHQTTSPPLGQTYPRATSGMGITSGTPVCRSSAYSVTQGRISYTHSSNSNIQPGMSPGRTSTPHEGNGRSNVLMPGQCHKSPSPAHMHTLPMSHGNNSTPPPTGSRIPPPSTSPRPNPTQGTILFTRATVPQQPMHSSSPHSINLPGTGTDGQPLNLQNNGSTKRKPVRDGSSRKRQKASEDQLMPPQLQPQYHIPPVTMPSSQETNTVSQTACNAQHGMSQNSSFSIATSEAPTLSPHAMVSSSPAPPSGLESHHSDQNQTYDELLKIKQKTIGIPPSNSPVSHCKRSDTPPKLSSCATASSPVSLNNLSMPPVLIGATSAVSESPEEKVATSSVQFTPNASVSTNSITTTGSTNHTKLKKAWLQRHSENEDKRNPSDRIKTEIVNPSNNGSSAISPGNNTSSIADKVSSANTKETKSSDKVLVNENSKTDGAKVPDDSTSSASETELELKNLKRKTRVGRKQNTASSASTSSKRQKTVSESSVSETSTGITTRKDDAKKKASPPEREVNSRRRGRKTKGRAAAAPPPPPIPDDVKKKPVVMKGGKNSTLPSPAKPFEKPSVAQLKRTGESFLQDGPCYLMAPKLPKCRECRMTPHQRNKKMPNIFCRFYAFRKLRYGKNGSIVSAGFSEPSDATEQDLKLWLPPVDSPPSEIDVDTAKYLLSTMGGQFCELVEQEKEAQRLHMSNDTTITWKRVLQGVRELCDVCDTTLFNIHWVCHKCGFVVCIDCYKARKNGNGKETSLKDRDMYQWLLCSNKQPHEQEKLTMTQIIARSALWDVGKALHEIHRKWNISFLCRCNNKTADGDTKDIKHSTNGICKQLMSAVTKCLTDKDRVQVNGSPRGKKRNSNGMSGVIKQEDGYSSESGSSPLSWLADVALNSSGKLSDEKGGQIKIKSELDDDDDERKSSISQLTGFEDGSHDEDDSNENFSTLRELLIRPAGKGGNGNRSNRNSVSNVKTTLSGLISNIVEQRVKKLDKDGKHSTHYTRRHSRECDPLRVCNLAESLMLQSDVPHSWLCNGKLLLLRDSEHEDNIKLFQEQWKLGEPIVVAGVGKKLDLGLWQPENLCQEFGDIKNDIINCKTGAVLPNMPMRKFWEGFENANKRMKDDDGEQMLLKSKWPMGDDFSELSPARFKDLMSVLPLPQYTLREGILNLASHLPTCFVHPDLGPKIFNAYGSLQHATRGTINLHIEMSDSVNVMVYVGVPKEMKEDERNHDIVKTYDEAGCDQLMKKRLKEKGAKPGALWHIYHADDADKINSFLLKIAKERGQESIRNPLIEQSLYLDEELRERLSDECSVESYAVVQCLGDAIFIPAGAPHQVRNLHSCIKVSEDFVSPENVAQCFNLIQQSQQSSDTNISHEDKLQIKNLIYHAVKNALAQLRANDPEDYQT